jgi:hypothetical protein
MVWYPKCCTRADPLLRWLLEARRRVSISIAAVEGSPFDAFHLQLDVSTR